MYFIATSDHWGYFGRGTETPDDAFEDTSVYVKCVRACVRVCVCAILSAILEKHVQSNFASSNVTNEFREVKNPYVHTQTRIWGGGGHTTLTHMI